MGMLREENSADQTAVQSASGRGRETHSGGSDKLLASNGDAPVARVAIETL